jgi:two-component system osmolarity sensor histidine kinase EnvZ
MARSVAMIKKKPPHFFKRLMPSGLLARSSIIIFAPVIFVQLTTAYIFYDRHWKKMTSLLAENIAGSINASTHIIAGTGFDKELLDDFMGFIGKNFGLQVTLYESSFMSSKQDTSVLNWREQYLYDHLNGYFDGDFSLSIDDDVISVAVKVDNVVLKFTTETKRLFTRTTPILLWWALATPIFFLIIAFIFMRNQVRPLRELSNSMEIFGKGRTVAPIKPSGAQEIRTASMAFNAMRERIMTQINQRTEMLAGVSHDLRTPLTRMALEVELMNDEDVKSAFHEDISQMRHIIDEYLAFVQGSEAEATKSINLYNILESVIEHYKFPSVILEGDKRSTVNGKEQSLKRAFINLLSNAAKYSCNSFIKIIKASNRGGYEVTIEDDGPGISANNRQAVFRPFFRVDTSRNQDTGGIGLGLSITKDIINSHGGTIELDDSKKMGGLLVRIYIPH